MLKTKHITCRLPLLNTRLF